MTPNFRDWAFNRARGAEIRQHWRLIPDHTDVIVTHGPPRGLLDLTHDGGPIGCDDLRATIKELRPLAHIFGHVHGQNGSVRVDSTLFVNASICDNSYRPSGEPIVVDLG